MGPEVSIDDLPEEILAHIFSFLPLHDLASSVPFVCEAWKSAWNASTIWKDATLTADHSLSEESLLTFLGRTPHLQALVLRRHVSDVTLRKACFTCRRLHTLRLHLYQHVSRDTLQTLARHCSSIRCLEIPARLLEDAESVTILDALKHLKELKCFTERNRERTTYLRTIADGFPNLERLSIHISLAPPEDIRYLFSRKGSQLVSVTLTVHGGDEQVLSSLADCRSVLRELILRYPDGGTLSLEGLRGLQSLHELRSLHLSGLACPNPKDLSLIFTERNTTCLTNLCFSNTYARLLVDDEMILKVCRHCPALENLELDLAHSKSLTDNGLELLPKLSRLRKLTLRFCRGLTGRTEKSLTGCKALQYLDLTGTSNVLIRGVLSLPRLRVLILDGCDGNGLNLRDIPTRLPRLEKLSIKSCNRLDEGSVSILRETAPHIEIIVDTTLFRLHRTSHSTDPSFSANVADRRSQS